MTERSARPSVEALEERLALSAHLLRDINVTTQASQASYFAAAPVTLGNYTYFSADDGVQHNALFRTDGTRRGTTLVKNLGGTSTTISNLTVVGNRLFFTADDGVHGNELWSSDGTASGTKIVLDINPNSSTVQPYLPPTPVGAAPTELTAFNGKLYFSADDGSHGRELWVSDGTASGTKLVVDLDLSSISDIYPAGHGPTELTIYKNRLFFFASDGTHGSELFSSDGTASGTALVKDINPGARGSMPENSWYGGGGAPGTPSMTVAGRFLLFSAYDASHGTELWRSDGTARGTLRVRDIASGRILPGQGMRTEPRSSTPTSLITLNGIGYFLASDGNNGYELWRSNGEARGTWMVFDALPGGDGYPHNLVVANNKLFFVTYTSTQTLNRLWSSDGTAAGTTLLTELNDVPFISPSADALLVAGNAVYFSKSTPELGRELWTTDGTVAGTHLVKDIRPGAGGAAVQLVGRHHNQLLFGADNGLTGLEMWISNGSSGGTTLLRDLNTNTGDANPSQAIALGNKTLFVADDGRRGAELWITDGTSGGTKIVRDINTKTETYTTGEVLPASSNIHNLVRLGSWVYFVADDGIHGEELWRTNGSTSGTRIVRDINRSGDTSITDLTVYNGKLYFSATDGVHGSELWVSDGTSGGTRMVRDLNVQSIAVGPPQLTAVPPGGAVVLPTQGSDPGSFAVFQGKLYFAADDGIHGRELYRTDGTSSGTTLVKDIRPTVAVSPWGAVPDGSNPDELTVVGDTLFFSADDGEHGIELWKSDGTQSGTVLVKEIAEGSELPSLPWLPVASPSRSVIPPGYGAEGSTPQHLTAFDGILYFVATDTTNGIGLWKSDGTTEGTQLVRAFGLNSFPYYFNNTVDQLTVAGDQLFLTASSDQEGIELWVSDGTTDGTHLVKDIFPGQSNNLMLPRSWANSSAPWPLTAVGGEVYFFAEDADHGRELWRSNGTGPGTVMVQDINPHGSATWQGNSFIAVAANGLFFAANDGHHGTEPWLLPLS